MLITDSNLLLCTMQNALGGGYQNAEEDDPRAQPQAQYQAAARPQMQPQQKAQQYIPQAQPRPAQPYYGNYAKAPAQQRQDDHRGQGRRPWAH